MPEKEIPSTTFDNNALSQNALCQSQEKESKVSHSCVQSSEKSFKLTEVFCFLGSLRIEPLMFLFMFSFILNTTCLTNMMIEKGCLYYFRYSTNVCDHIFDHHNERDNVEMLANNFNLYLDCLELVAAAIVIFIAPWSDKYSRKIPLTIALFGFFLNDIGIILCTFYFDSRLEFIILSNLPTQFCGGFICVMTMIYSHSSEVSSEEFRSMKYTFLQISFGLAVTLGALTGGQIYHFYGYLTVFFTAAVGHLFAMFWVVFFVPETKGLDEKVSFRKKFEDFYTSRNFIEGLKTSLMPRKNKGRTQLWFLFLSSCSISIMYKVYTDTSYVYAHHMYGWDPTVYSQMWTMFSFIELIIILVLITLFIRVFKLDDSLIGIIGSISIILKTIFLAVAVQLWLYYLSNIVGSLNLLGSLAVKTFISKLIPEDERGKVFSFLATCEAVVPLLGSSVILKIFNATIKIFPGTFYLVATVFLFLPLGTFVWLYQRGRELSIQDTSKETQ